ncbi:hypothetical protein MVEN_02024800 [Mycena venus]|uniref:Uncharacterized protein n=1 Tax=Mycena venus TaxID=2733690 RepID=A0A8H6XC40_9AGAR|nr:hypothetical protein MVEN_02024800 [Mycena venus]
MRMPHISTFIPPFGEKFSHDFLVLAIPEEKYGHHTALVWHGPKQSYHKVVARFGRMEREIANAELLGEIRMSRPYEMDQLERDADSLTKGMTFAGPTANSHHEYARHLFTKLKDHREGLKGESVVLVAVYMVEVRTNRENVLFDGQKASLPSGYLTYYTGRGKLE